MDRQDGDGATSDSGSNVIEHKAYARVGLLGNPSDVYFGNTIAFSLANFWASVKLQPSDELVINPHPTHDLVLFRSIHQLVPQFSFSLENFSRNAFYCLLDQ